MSPRNAHTHTHTHTHRADKVDRDWVAFSASPTMTCGDEESARLHLGKRLKIQARSAHILLCRNLKGDVATDLGIDAVGRCHVKNNTHVRL